MSTRGGTGDACVLRRSQSRLSFILSGTFPVGDDTRVGMSDRHATPLPVLLSRRIVLAGVAGTLVLAACGSDSSSSDSAEATEPNSTEPSSGLALVRFFDDPSVTTGTNRRLVFGLADLDGTLRTSGPSEVAAVLLDSSGAQIATTTGRRRDVNLPRAYYEFRVDVAQAAVYTLRVTEGDATADGSFTVADKGSLPFPGPGDMLPPFATPTVTDAQGVDPVCTRQPACPFHDVTLGEALAAGAPVVYLVGTPAFCQTGICGPVLDVMIGVTQDYPSLKFLHAEVYTDNTATEVAPAVNALGLSFEPVIFLTDASGKIVERLDVIVDESELREQLTKLV